MTEVQILGGPLDGRTLDTAGNPEPGERIIYDGSLYQLQPGPTEADPWTGLWRGWATDREGWPSDDLTDREVAKLAAALREHEARRDLTRRRLEAAITLVAFSASVGAAVGGSLAILAGLGRVTEWLAELAGGWVMLCLALAVLGAVLAGAACAVNWQTLHTYDERTRQ